MGYRGTLRAINSFVRMHERSVRREAAALQRKAREIETARNAAVRDLQQLEARMEVEIYEAMIAALGSVHKECGPTIDWAAVAEAPAPRPPPEPDSEAAAQRELDSYRPGVLARVFGGAKRHRTRLEAALLVGRASDDRQRAADATTHREELAAWRDMVATARAVLAREPDAFAKALDDLDVFEELNALGLKIGVGVPTGRHDAVRVHVAVEERSVVPAAVKSLTKTGKVSSKAMPKTKAADIYQDYVCGAVLRVAREVFAALPVEYVLVTASTDLLDPATGHTKPTPVLSAIASRQRLQGLAFDALDPSAAMSNTIHRMSFKRSEGMREIEPLRDRDIPPAA